MPLTTRPWLTSRQGMMRAVSISASSQRAISSLTVRARQLRMELAGEHATALERGDEAPAVLGRGDARIPAPSSTR